MNYCNFSSSPLTSVELNDTEHTLIWMTRSMGLNEIFYMMMLNNFFPKELQNKYDHIRNIINLNYHKSYEIHVIRSMIEFISTNPTYSSMFQQQSLQEMISKYQTDKIAESNGVCELYVKPYTSECIECKRQLETVFSHRPKTVLSSTRHYDARMLLFNFGEE